MPRNPIELTVGGQWAYRQKQTEPVTCVEVLRLGTGKPARVLVRFIDEFFEGRQDWVPPARLKVPWEQVDHWRQLERQLSRVYEANDASTDEINAWDTISGHLRDDRIVGSFGDSGDGVLRIPDVDAVVADLGLDRDEIAGDPVAYVDDDGWLVVPWRVTKKIVLRVAAKHADHLLDRIEAEEAEARQHNQWGYRSGSGWISAEICAEVDQKYRPGRELARTWCGADANDRHDELVALRGEVHQLGLLMERAIIALRESGSPHAMVLERDLGIPVEALQHIPRPDTGR